MNPAATIHIAVLLNGSIINDSRVIKVIKTLSSVPNVFVDLFYIEGSDKDKTIFADNVALYNCEFNVTFKVNFIRHTFFYNEFLFFVDKVLDKKIKYDYIYANDLTCVKPSLILKSKIGAKVIYDAHEIYTETINQFFPKEASFPKKSIFNFLVFFMRFFGEKAENNYLKKVDFFITVCEGLKLYFEKKYQAVNTKVLMNVPFKQGPITPVNIRGLLNLKASDFLIVYQGIFNSGRGIYQTLDALKYTNPNIKLILLGYGPLETELKDHVKANNLSDKIFFLEKVDSKILLNYTKGFDSGIVLLEPINLSNKFAAPNKLFEYMHAGIPVIASYSFETTRVFDKYHIGIQTEVEAKAIAEAMNKMSTVNTAEFKQECQKAALEYNWENQEYILTDILKEKQRS